jgi:excisionase family DNA binding protein
MTVQNLDPKIVLTVAQAAEEAQVCEGTIRYQIRKGYLRPRRIGRIIRITRIEFDRWLNDYDLNQ